MPDRREEINRQSCEEEYVHHLLQAQYHIRHALAQVDNVAGPRRSALCKTLLRKTLGILSGLYVQESHYQRRNR